MRLSQSEHRFDPVHARHVQIDDRRLGPETVDELDGSDPVGRAADDAQLRLVVDQVAEGLQVELVVVGNDNPNRVKNSPHA